MRTTTAGRRRGPRPPGPDPARIRRTARRLLARLPGLPVNFDVPRLAELAAGGGWNTDSYCRPLPPEPAGQPLEDGSWAVARRLLEGYEFADPTIISTVYHVRGPLEGRNMVLEARFHGLRFHLAVRIAEVWDEAATVDGRPVRRWGWSYRTLAGHLESGQMDYEIRKWTDTGQVEFGIHVVSRPAEIANPIVRMGFALFGRRMQVRFARRALDRMEALVTAELLARSGVISARRPPGRIRKVVIEP